jgi:uncharacterized protein
MDFEWNPTKDLENIKKHKVSFAEAMTAFSDLNGFDLKDVKHSRSEVRHYWVGRILDGRVITVRYTMRGDVIRIIGAAEWREFRRLYYEKAKNK